MIKIAEGLWTTTLHSNEISTIPTKWEECEICKLYILSKIYVYIIDCLKEAGLLPSGYKKICCTCFTIKKKIGSNYHKGCDNPLVMVALTSDSVGIVCTDCDITVGRITEIDGELVGEIYEEIERDLNEI